MTFESLFEAKAAFAMEQTEFRRGDEAFVIFVDKANQPRGHEMVIVEGVAGINSQGQPI